MTLLIQAANIDYAYGGNDVLTGATFEIRQGDRLALIGANGSGKSTLFRLMAGQLQPQRGALTLARGTRVGFLSQEPAFRSRSDGARGDRPRRGRPRRAGGAGARAGAA